jgi:hypothetical protein
MANQAAMMASQSLMLAALKHLAEKVDPAAPAAPPIPAPAPAMPDPPDPPDLPLLIPAPTAAAVTDAKFWALKKSLASDGPVTFMDYTDFNFYVRVGDQEEDETAVWDSFDSFQEAGDYVGAPREEEEEEEKEGGDEGAGEEEEEVVLDPPQPAKQIPPAAAAAHIGRNTMSGINRDNMARNAVALLTSNPRFPAIGGTPVSWVEAERNWQEFSLSSFLGDRMTAWDDGQKGRCNKRKRAHEEVVRVRGDSMSTLMETAIGLDEERSNLRNEKNRPMTFSIGKDKLGVSPFSTGFTTLRCTGFAVQLSPM